MNRREFLHAGCTIAAASLVPSVVDQAEAHFMRGAFVTSVASGFNGGKSEIQSTVPSLSGDFPFINLVKSGLFSWLGTDSDNTGSQIDPSWLDANGYPSASALSGSSFGVFLNMDLPLQSSRVCDASNPMVITWVGNAVVKPGNAPITFVSGSQNAILNGYGFSDNKYHGRYVWYPTAYDANDVPGTFSFQLNLVSIATGSSDSYCDNLQMFFSADETALLAGNIFGIKYKQTLQQANAGVFRFMDWVLTNISTTTTWDTRKPLNNPTWSADEYRASLYPGDIMTNSGNAYSLTTGSFTLADKLTMHIHFSANSTISINSQSGFNIGFPPNSSPQTMTVSLTPALTIGWTSHGLSNGQILGAVFTGNAPTDMQTGVNYYVVNATTNTFQLALIPGGTAIAPASLNGGLFGLVTIPTLSLNGSAGIPIRDAGGSPILETVASTIGTGSVKLYGTVVFDQALGCWLMSGGTQNKLSSGLQNGIPVEICLQLCKELGAHPYFSIPYLALDPMTDYVPSLASYVKSNGPGWMIPRFEAGNEVWNTLTPITGFAANKAWALWQTPGLDDWCGMVNSTLGQAVAAAYGHGNLGTTYEVLVGVQTDGMAYPLSNPSPIDPRMTSAQYVANGPAQAGYTQSAASGWASAVLVSNYISPGMRGTTAEWQLAWDWFFTSANNPTQQAADLNTYVDTLQGVNKPFTIPYETDRWHGAKDWASRFSVNKMSAYEGGYSPDLMPSYYDTTSFNGAGGCLSVFQCPPTSPVPTQASQCVIAVGTPTGREGFPVGPGNPAVAGMLVYLSGATGMTQLNCGFAGYNSPSPSFTNGVADVTWNSHNLNPNQVVQFAQTFAGALPSNIVPGQRYFVISTNLTTNTFQFSATRGGSAVVPNATASSGCRVFSAFAVVSTTSTTATIDVDSTAFPTATATPMIDFPNSQTIINNFRSATLMSATDLTTLMIASYDSFTGEGGSFPAQYEVSGTNSIWPPVQPDIYGAQSGEFAAIVAYNH